MNSFGKYQIKSLSKSIIAPVIFFEVVFGIILSFVGLAIFFNISAAVTHGQTQAADGYITNLIYLFRADWLTLVMFAVSFLGSEAIIFGLVLVTIMLTIRKHKREAFIFSLLLIMGAIATNGLKIFYKVPRPDILPLAELSSYSYPSGHALNSFLFYSTICYFIYHFTKHRIISAFVFVSSAVLVFLIGVSRVYLGVHRPSDVAAGFVVGFWLLVTTIVIERSLMFFGFIKEKPDK